MTDPGAVAAAVALGLASGSIPFAPLLARRALGVDVRAYGDGNPGATNVGRAGGRRIGALAAFLDILKGAFPVGLAVAWGIDGWALVPVALAPTIGHCWSPWLRFRGGKGTATAYGALLVLTPPVGPVLLPAALVLAWKLLEPDGWAPLASLAAMAAWLAATGAPLPLLVVVGGTALIVGSRYRADLAQGLRLRRRTPRPGAPGRA